MSEHLTFEQIIIEGFRGFRDRRVLDLAASAVIVSGPNGTGKTSLFDSFQWLLLGRIERLEGLRLRQTDEFLVNQYRLPGPATVEAKVTIRGQSVRLRRSGNSRSSLLEWEAETGIVRGQEAERLLEQALAPSPTVTLASALMTSALLQQDVMRSMLEAKGSERFQHLNQLLGLETLEEFEQAARAYAKEMTESTDAARTEEETIRKQRDSAEARLAALEARAAARPSVESAREVLLAALRRHESALVVTPGPTGVEDISLLAAEAKMMNRRLSSLLDDWLALQRERAILVSVTDDEVADARDQLSSAQARLLARSQELESATRTESDAEARSQQLARLAAIAIPLLSETCPICGQRISPGEVAQELQARAANTGDLIALREARERVEKLRQEAEREARNAEKKAAELERVQAQHANLEERASNLLVTVKASLATGERFQFPGLASLDEFSAEQLQATLSALREVSEASDRLGVLMETGAVAEEDRRLRAEITAFKEAEAARRKRVEELARKQAEAKKLQEATIAARVAVTKRRVNSLRPLVADIYNRLDPHPAFKDLDLEHDVYRARGTTTTIARDSIEGREANPVLIFSSSQANIAALSYFLALGYAAGERALPFVLLDDPLQSMDDINVLGFADLCRFIRSERQLLISTHEGRFAALLERKLAPRGEGERTLVVRFRGWDRTGPDIEAVTVSPQLAEVSARLAAA